MEQIGAGDDKFLANVWPMFYEREKMRLAFFQMRLTVGANCLILL